MQPENPYKRILVYGVTGSGKTTLANRIASATGITWHSVDDLSFEPNWVQVPTEIQRERITAICEGEEWILDTAYSAWIDVPLARAELIVGLDYPRWLSLTRLARRTLSRLIDKRSICNGNQESWKSILGKNSILLWHFKTFERKRTRIRTWARQDHPKLIHVRSPKQLERWLASLKR